MYAVYTTLLCSSDDPIVLQQELNINMYCIGKWFHENKLTLNVKKTKFLIFVTNYI